MAMKKKGFSKKMSKGGSVVRGATKMKKGGAVKKMMAGGAAGMKKKGFAKMKGG